MPKKDKIKNDELLRLLNAHVPLFPKYTTQLMNLANQNSQGTRPQVVGQMSELIQLFPGESLQEWEEWYLDQNPNAIEDAANRIYTMITSFQDAITQIDKEMVSQWVADLVITKTYAGLRVQGAILKHLGEKFNCTYRTATPEEEGRNIDGVIGTALVSVKPITFKTMLILPIEIKVHEIYYDKTKDGLVIEYADSLEEELCH